MPTSFLAEGPIVNEIRSISGIAHKVSNKLRAPACLESPVTRRLTNRGRPQTSEHLQHMVAERQKAPSVLDRSFDAKHFQLHEPERFLLKMVLSYTELCLMFLRHVRAKELESLWIQTQCKVLYFGSEWEGRPAWAAALEGRGAPVLRNIFDVKHYAYGSWK